MEKAITKKEEKVEVLNPMQLIEMATKEKVDVATMEKLMDLQDRWENKKAKKAFDEAMAAFQAKCPEIKKTILVKNKDGSARYRYANLPKIVKQVKPLIEEFGFSYRIEASAGDKSVKATCVVVHEEGHSESSSFEVPIDTDSFMNTPQRFASALTFAKRYAFSNAFGILTADDDDDAKTAGEPDKMRVALDMVAKAKDVKALEKYKADILKSPAYNEGQRSRIIENVDIKIEELKEKK